MLLREQIRIPFPVVLISVFGHRVPVSPNCVTEVYFFVIECDALERCLIVLFRSSKITISI